MKPMRIIEEAIRNRLNVTASPALRDRVLAHVRRADVQSKESTPALRGSGIGRTIMRNPMVKLGIAAAVVVAVLIGINQLGGSATGLAWGEVVKKVEASRGLIYRASHPSGPDAGIYHMFYNSPTHGRMDMFKDGQAVRSIYGDYDARNMLLVHYEDKCVLEHPMDDRDVQDHEREMHLNDWVEGILSRPHTNLGSKTIGGVLCEGIETRYPIFGDADSPREDSATRVWVSVASEYPVLCESGRLADDGKLQVETMLDQFQWDVELAASEFEPNIPPDFERIQ